MRIIPEYVQNMVKRCLLDIMAYDKNKKVGSYVFQLSEDTPPNIKSHIHTY